VIAAAPPPLTNQTPATFALAGAPPGDVGWFDCAVDSFFIMFCPVGPGDTITFGGLSEGPHTLLARAVDPAGNSLEPVRYDWTIDRTPPETRIKAAPAGATSATAALIEFDSERDATFVCSLDAAPLSACSSPLALDGLAVGRHTILVIAVDPAGNRDETPATASWVVEEPTELPAAGPPPKPRPVAAGRLVPRWQRRAHGTRARVLKVAGVARRTTVTVRCTGRGCPVGRRSTTARRQGTVGIAALLEGAALRRGAKLEVAIARRGRTTRLVRFTFGAPGAAPARRELCRTSATASARPCPAPGT